MTDKREIKAVPDKREMSQGSQSGNSTSENARRALDEAAQIKKQLDEKKK